jgi:hypothetical protein
MAQCRATWRALVNAVMNFCAPQNSSLTDELLGTQELCYVELVGQLVS